MLRRRGLPTTTANTEAQDGRVELAKFFGLDVMLVVPQPQPETYSVIIGTNKEAQEQYKTINKFGNIGIPGGYDFNKEILVRWDGKAKAA